jgi:SAM-dependent methyltransferase
LSEIRRLLKRIVPRRIQDLRTHVLVRRQRRVFRGLSVEETFERVYAEGRWGPADAFDSGDGSSRTELTDPYVALVRDTIADLGVRSVADLGCGDFRVGRRLLEPGTEYVGVDVVESLIERNARQYGDEHVAFRHLNLVVDELPDAELALLRQVLQHLSNDEILAVLENTRKYRYLLVTEHVPTEDPIAANVDKSHGPDVRLLDRSGVFLDQPPFSLPTRTLLELPYAPGEVLRTVMVENA